MKCTITEMAYVKFKGGEVFPLLYMDHRLGKVKVKCVVFRISNCVAFSVVNNLIMWICEFKYRGKLQYVKLCC